MIAALFLGLTILGITFLPVSSYATPLNSSDGYTAKLNADDVDAFTYRISFHLDDGTESFLIRSKFGITYLFQHHQPTITQHYIWGSLGVYYGRTSLGRSIIANLTFESMAFYPFWRDINGVFHDFKDDKALFMRMGWIPDGQMVGGMILVDSMAPSKYVQLFGGTLVIKGLTLDMGNTKIEMGDIEIELAKNYNDYVPSPASMQSEENFSYTSDFAYLNALGGGITPFVVTLDSVLSISLLGAILVFTVLIVLHIKGKIKLPFHKLGQIKSRSPNPE